MCGAAALFAGLVYLNALHNPFVYDDYHTVVANPSILHVANLRAIVLYDMTRPIVNLSYAIDRAVWGAAPFGFHLTNVLLHMFDVVLLFQLAWLLAEDLQVQPADRRVRQERTTLVAFAAATIFAVHPMMTEAVGYISGRSEVLCTTFFLAGLLCGRQWIRGNGARWAGLTIGLWVAALATKEVGGMFPFVLFCYDWLVPVRLEPDTTSDPVENTAFRRRILTIHVPLIGIAVAGGIARLAVLARVEYPGQVTVHWSYLLIGADVVRRYVMLILRPTGQTIFHEVAAVNAVWDPRALAALTIVGLMAALAWRWRRAAPLVSLGMLWFLLLLVPSTVLIALDRGEPMAEHRVYLASCGLFLAAGAALVEAGAVLSRVRPRTWAVVPAVLAVVLLSFMAQTVWRNAVWSSPVSLWQESVDLAPTHYRPRLLLGEALADSNRRTQAIEEFRTALRLRPTEPAAYAKLGDGLVDLGQFAEGAAVFRRLQDLDPRSPIVSNGLGVIALLSGETDQARQYFREALARDSRNVAARQSLAFIAETEPADPAEALRLCREIQQLAPQISGTDDCIRRNQSRLAAAVAGR